MTRTTTAALLAMTLLAALFATSTPAADAVEDGPSTAFIIGEYPDTAPAMACDVGPIDIAANNVDGDEVTLSIPGVCGVDIDNATHFCARQADVEAAGGGMIDAALVCEPIERVDFGF